MPRPRAALLLLLCSTITTALRPTRRRDLFAVTAATYWKWGFAATGVLHATHAATALDEAFPAPPPRKSERPMITVTPLVHRGKLPRPRPLRFDFDIALSRIRNRGAAVVRSLQ